MDYLKAGSGSILVKLHQTPMKMLLLKAPFLPPVISLDDILKSIATNYFENYMTWKSKPIHVLSCKDIYLNLINLFILKLSFISISALLLQSQSCISEV